ncbi:MAG: acyclic terpene utilization AtuA family protein, partial [Actinomycetota bacterium]
MAEPIRIANASGFYGDRLAAVHEQVTLGDIDVVTGDYLAELTMLLLWKAKQKSPEKGYAVTFLRQMEATLGEIASRGVKVVANAGGLNPAGLADELRTMIEGLGLSLRVAHVEGDNLLPVIDDLVDLEVQTLTANAYLGAWGIAEALGRGADIVVTGRVADAALVVGPAAWHHEWRRDDWDALAGAVVAGHVLECGAQATGGNFAFFREVQDLTRAGFPIAEIAADGSSVITKHEGTGGAVTVGTITAQILYEIDEPAYRTPDVVAHFDTIELSQIGPDCVEITGVQGSPAPEL